MNHPKLIVLTQLIEFPKFSKGYTSHYKEAVSEIRFAVIIQVHATLYVLKCVHSLC